MALQYAFRLGTLTFAATLIRSALEGASFVNGLQDSMIIGLIFLCIGFVIGEISRHIVEELVERELASAILSAETGGKDVKAST
ncbi:MAG: hypothetical protein JKY95_07900 [Planctomycetaceae bacterium]|nr:hypothetical protein [Planctomycetaceae bacterium]